MLAFIKKHWILLLLGLGAVYYFVTKKETATGSSSATNSSVGTNVSIQSANLLQTKASSVVDPLNIVRYPPPGYAGPANGPFTWAGLGAPPNGEYTVLGLTVPYGTIVE